VLGPGELGRLLDKRKTLIDVARPFMGNLYQFVASSLFVVLLCDERGYILETVGDPEVIEHAPDLNFDRGALWTEAEIGNNGVGTSLHLRRPFQVSGCEHYCRKHHPWTCSGAPIFSDDGVMIGVLEMSGPVAATHQHTLGMVVAASEAIRQQLRVLDRNRELTRLNSHLSSLFLSVSDGVVVLDDQGLVQQVNPVAETIFQARTLVATKFTAHLDKPGPIHDLLNQGRAFSDLEIGLDGPDGRARCLASGKPIRDDLDRVTGAVVFLNPIHRINKLINRFSGAQASFTFEDILGSGEALGRAVQQGVQAAASDVTVLLCGESGTGKEMFAQSIHNRSPRRSGPFIAVNCGAIPRELVGSELFGYVEGAFTGAHRRGRPGKFELAAGGTLFLDEIGDMPMEQQASLLRVLQDKSITRIGGGQSVQVDVRIICATNKDLPVQIARGDFRQDLYFRLNVISIFLPPLRQQRDDIPLLFRTFYERACRKLGRSPVPVEPEVIERLQSYPWPGNMREFQNVVERLVTIPGQRAVDLASLPEWLLAPSPLAAPAVASAAGTLREERQRLRHDLAEQERQRILEQLRRHRGNLTETARDLGLSRTSLYRKLGRD
jgi:transcriptional regulator of acetoin/glycerol metabolism